MDMALRSPRRPLCCGRDGIPFGIKPACGSFSQSFPCCKDNGRFRTLPCMVANSDDSRRRSKKGLIPKPKGNAPKGFSPRPQVGKSTQRKDQNDSEEKESAISSSSHYALAQSKSTDMEAAMESPIEEKIGSSTGLSNNAVSIRVGVLDEADEQDYMIKDQTSGNVLVVKESETIDDSPIGEKSFEHEDGGHARKHLSVDCSDEEVGKEEDTNTDGGMAGMKEGYNDEEVGKEGDPNTDGGMAEMKEGYNDEEFGKVGKEGDPHTDGGMAEMKEGYNDEEVRKVGKEGGMAEMKEGYNDEEVGKEGDPNTDGGMAEMKEGYNDGEVGKEEDPNTDGDMAGMKEGCSDEEVGKEGDPNTDGGMVGMKQDITDEHALTDESWLKQKQYVEAQTQIMILKDLARENLANGNKVFVFPQTVKPDQNIEVFLNRSLSTLINENEVYIMGAFNAWRWKSFKEKLQKTNLEGDWWSCLIYVPKEAYMIDFVFFNGGHMYENNNAKDFSIPVEGGMDEFAFEDFMLEEKRKELERLAAEQAERERHAEEQLRREVEKAAIEADRAQAKLEVEKKRESLHRVMPLARTTEWDLWHIQPSIFKAEDRVRLYYNRSSRPLADAIEIWIHGGHNNWSEGLSIVERLVQSEKKDGDWWYAEVVIPDRALVLDWVFADGPPQNAKVYDNNNHIDFHAAVPKCMSEELFWVEEEHKIFRKLQGERKATEEAIRQKTERTARMKAETKERTRKMFLLSRKHIIYTEPLDVQAGTTVTIFYNPSSTILSGKPEVWFRCSFNCWTHCNGPLPPQKMFPSDCGSYLKARVKVPLDAYVMDFVFSEREDGGVFDNKYGMDYHIPVYGGIVKVPPMHIVHIAVEVAPIAKVGGLGDVVTSLSRAVQDLGHHVDIIMPKYDCMNLSNVKDFQYERNFFWGGTEIKVWFGKVEGLPVYFLEPQNGMFWVGCVYGKNNDAERFEFFCHAALEYLLQSGSHPDILHCHDWSSAPVAWLFKEQYRHYGLSNARVIFTIHNLEFGAHFIGKAMAHADKATTVSHTYSKEVSGNSLISPHLHKFHGILNGIDPDIWDPYNDKFIPVCYTSENVVEGKKAAKTSLQQRLGLRQSDHPLVGIITRLTVQKGIHLIKHAIWRTLERNGQVVLLGSSPDPRIQNDFVNLANQLHFSHADRVRLCLTYDEPLSHLIYAGSDFILVPSLFEPCGLTQLIAMRYGAIPVVRRTGGLYDTVFDVDNDKERAQNQGLEPNGFSFEGTDTAGVDYALNRAISAWYDGREWFNCLCKRVMEQDWSWNRPALDYMELYHSARK